MIFGLQPSMMSEIPIKAKGKQRDKAKKQNSNSRRKSHGNPVGRKRRQVLSEHGGP